MEGTPRSCGTWALKGGRGGGREGLQGTRTLDTPSSNQKRPPLTHAAHTKRGTITHMQTYMSSLQLRHDKQIEGVRQSWGKST